MGNTIQMSGMFVTEIAYNVSGMKAKSSKDIRIDGKVVIVTGANTGIGKETARDLAGRGAKVIIASRNIEKANDAIKDIKSTNPSANITAVTLDLSSLESVRSFAKQIARTESKVDILINNAAATTARSVDESETVDGFEMQFGTNHLGHFLLTLLLLPLLKKSSSARIVNVSSDMYKFGKIEFEDINLRNGAYDVMKAYSQSKLANVLFTRELAKRLGSGSNVKVYCLSPGFVHTQANATTNAVSKFFMNMIAQTPAQGAQTSIYCAIDDKLENETGNYYDNCHIVKHIWPNGLDDEAAAKLWDLSIELVGLDEKLTLL